MAGPTFFKRLENACREKKSLLCVGIDPHSADLVKDTSNATPAAKALTFALNLIEKTHAHAVAVKPNSAFFEALGPDGVAALSVVCAEAKKKGLLVVLDNKRGDIGSTSAAYATAAYDVHDADCVTLNAYMGYDSLESFLVGDYAEKGCFVLCKTSNPSSNDFQTLITTTRGGEMLYEVVAKRCQALLDTNHAGQVGLVVGATDVDALGRARAAAPDAWILAPGVGFQGGDLEATVKSAVRPDGLGLLVPVSRGISRADDPCAAAENFKNLLNSAKSSSKKRKTDGSDSSSVAAIDSNQSAFFELALDSGVLRFGSFVLKSGRTSPYFFNAGLFDSGKAISTLAVCYAKAVLSSGLEYDAIFGPAYKGIPLASSICAAIYALSGRDVPFVYNRKEPKDHGEGGVLVGKSENYAGKRLLVVDDVITAGTAIREAIGLLKSEAKATVAGVVVALDRKEKRSEDSEESAVQAVGREFGIPVVSIVNLDALLTYLKESGKFETKTTRAVEDYRTRYGV